MLWFVACCARSPGLRHPAAVAAWHLSVCLGCGLQRASLACLVAPRGAPRLVWSGRSRCSGRLSPGQGVFPQPWSLRPRFYWVAASGTRRLAKNRADCACRWPLPRQGRWARSASYSFGALRWGCPWRVPAASVLGCVRCDGWRVWTRSLTRPVFCTVRGSTGDSAGAPQLFRVDADTSPCGSEEATPGSRVCVRVRVPCGQVRRAGLPGAFSCASPFPLAALSFCFAWPPPGWGCSFLGPLFALPPPLASSFFLCCFLHAPSVSCFLWFPAPAAPGLGAAFYFFCWLSVRSRLVCVSRLAVGCSLVVAAPLTPLLRLAVFVAAARCLGFFFLLLFAPPLSLAFSGFRPRVPWALALCLGFFFPPASRLSVRSRLFCVSCLAVGCSLVVAAPPLPPPPPFFSLCAPLVFGFRWFPAPGALGLGALFCLFCGPPAAWLSVRSCLVFVSRPAVGCSLVVASPPPLLCLAVFVAAARCSVLVVRPLCLCPSLAFGPWCPRPRRSVLFASPPPASRLSVRSRPFCASRLAVGCSLVVAAPPPPFCRLAVFVTAARCCVPCAVLCCETLGAVLRRTAARCAARCCAVVCCVDSLRFFGAAACCAVPSGTGLCPGALCFAALCCAVFPQAVCSVLCVFCRGVVVHAVVRRSALCCVCPGVLCCAFPVLCAVRCCASLCWCACVVLFLWCVLLLAPGAVVRCCVLCWFLWCAVVRCWVWWPVVVCRWRVSVSVSLSGRLVCFPVVGLVCCGALLPCVVFCGALLSRGAVLLCSAVVLRCCWCLLCPPVACPAVLCCAVGSLCCSLPGGGVCVLWCFFLRAVRSLSSPLCVLPCLAVLAVVPCFPVLCAVALCCCALLSCCGAVCACFALLWPVVRRRAVLCCAVGCLCRFLACGGVCVLWCPFLPCRHAQKTSIITLCYPASVSASVVRVVEERGLFVRRCCLVCHHLS